MPGGAQLSVTDMRNSVRCPVDYVTLGEHLTLGDIELHVCNVSNQGFMVDGCSRVERGHRVIVRLPVIGRIEGCCIWTHEDRAGFQFERIIRPDEYAEMLAGMQPRMRLRRPS
jgi:hypothetical protein